MHKIPHSTLRSVFSVHHNTEITYNLINQLLHWVTIYELYKEHPTVLNTPYFGINNMFFTETHQMEIYSICQIERYKFIKDITTIATVDSTKKVISEPFNLLLIWMAHLIITSHLQGNLKHDGLKAIFKIMHYRFFTSLVNHRFPFKADLNIMITTIESLSNKFDIVRLGTWKKVIEERAEDVFNKSSIHYRTLLDFRDDKKNFYLISDVQSRLRDKINLITTKFHEVKNSKDIISNYSAIGTDLDGKKVLKDTSGTLALIQSNLSQDILSTNNFIDNQMITLLCGMNKELKPYMLKSLIIRFVDIAIYQNKKGQLDLIKDVHGSELILGHRKLIEDIIQVTYRNCISQNANMKNKHDILRVTGNIYRSSQIQDPAILRIKKSVEYFVQAFPGTTRYNTQLALRINFILYVILMTFKYI